MSAIYRIPPYKLGPQIFMAHEVADKQPWGLVRHQVPDLFAETMGEGIVVAILDTGLWQHPDLPDPVFSENFSNSHSIHDAQGHGTHVAGTVGARLNGAGVVGWAPKCDLACCKVLGDDGSGTDEGIAAGVRYAVAKGAHIINMSLGGPRSPEIVAACQEAVAAGVFVLCAAGNAGRYKKQNTICYPARLPETLAIASYRKDGKISDFSSWGKQVDIAFPGEDVLSTWLDNGFREISGTSMATPAASGLTALMLAAQKKTGAVTIRNNAELRAHWRAHSQDQGAPGRDNSFGWGVPDAMGIVRAAPTT